MRTKMALYKYSSFPFYINKQEISFVGLFLVCRAAVYSADEVDSITLMLVVM